MSSQETGQATGNSDAPTPCKLVVDSIEISRRLESSDEEPMDISEPPILSPQQPCRSPTPSDTPELQLPLKLAPPPSRIPKQPVSEVMDEFIYHGDESECTTSEFEAALEEYNPPNTEELATNDGVPPFKGKKYKGHVELDTILRMRQSEPLKNYLTGVKCIMCRCIINPAPIVKCLECKYVNPYICVPCFRVGTYKGKHRKGHAYTLLDPKGPPVFKAIPGKRQFGIMEDVALLYLLCDATPKTWEEKNLIFPDFTYEDAVDRFEDLLMSDIGSFLRECDPLCANRRPIHGSYAEEFIPSFTPEDAMKLKAAMPTIETRFTELMDVVDTVESDEELEKPDEKPEISIRESPGLKIEPDSSERSSVSEEWACKPCKVEPDEKDVVFQRALDKLYERARKGQTKFIEVQDTEYSKEEEAFNPYIFNAYVKAKNKKLRALRRKARKEAEAAAAAAAAADDEEVEPEPEPCSSRTPIQKRKRGRKPKFSGHEGSEEVSMDASVISLIPKAEEKPIELVNFKFVNPYSDLQTRRRANAKFRKQLRAIDTKAFIGKVFPNSSSNLDISKNVVYKEEKTSGEEESDAENTDPMMTLREQAFENLDDILEEYHKQMGFDSDDDWGIEIDEQFSRTLDHKDRDYDHTDLHLRHRDGPIFDRPIKPYRNQVIKQQVKNLDRRLGKKWKAHFTIQSKKVLRSRQHEDQLSSSSDDSEPDASCSLYATYEAPYSQFNISNGKEVLNQAEFEAVTYNPYRHDYEIQNRNQAEHVLNNIARRQEPIGLCRMLSTFKINSYQRVLKERDAQASFAREYRLLPTFMEYTKKVVYPIGHTPDIDAIFEEFELSELKDQYRSMLVATRQILVLPMFHEYLNGIIQREIICKQIAALAALKRSGITKLPE